MKRKLRPVTRPLAWLCVILLMQAWWSGCRPSAGDSSVPTADGEIGRITHFGRDGIWINLGARQGLEVDARLWAWGVDERPPARTAPLALLRVGKLGDDDAHCLIEEGGRRGLEHGWVLRDGGGQQPPAGSRLAVPAPVDLPDATGWPQGSRSLTAGGGAFELDLLSLLAFEPLVREHRHALLPGVARRWSVDPDGRTWRLQIAAGRRWTDGTAVTAAAARDAIDEALQAEPLTLAAALLAGPPRVENDAILLTTRATVADFPRFLGQAELGLRSAAGGVGAYRLELDGALPGFRRLRHASGPATIEVVLDDPKVSFYLGRTHVWRGLGVAAPLTERRLGASGDDPEPRRAAIDQLWIMLAIDPARRHQLPEIDREELLRTYLGAGESVSRLAALVLDDTQGGAATDETPIPTTRGKTAITDTQSFRIIVPRALPEPLGRMAERLQAVLIRSGEVATLEHGDPRAAGTDGTIAVLAMSPRSADPCLRLWDLVRALDWLDPDTAPALRDKIAEVAARPDRARMVNLAGEIATTFGLVPIARLPVEWWLRDEVIADPVRWHWPHLWVESSAGQGGS